MIIWYIARGMGLTALVLLTATTCLGATGGAVSSPSRRVVTNHLHRVTAAAGLAALALHITTILTDSYAHVGWLGMLIPSRSGYRPTWVGLGTLALYTIAIAVVVGVARGRMAASPRAAHAWRRAHALAYVGWTLAVLHGLRSGTDTGTAWVRGLYVACIVAVVGSVLARVATTARPVVTGRVARPSRPAAGVRR
jgi:predicted ferric reductase